MTDSPDPREKQSQSAWNARLAWLDMARGGALIAMAVYHFAFDLEMFGLIARGTALAPPWSWLASATAGSFLFLAGLSLQLAHGGGIRWRAAWRRLLKIGAAAALVSGATYAVDPGTFIFFGILHAIALYSLLGLALLRLPVAVLLVLAGALLTLGPALAHPVFGHPALLWTGLSPRPPLTLDFIPLFPWAAPFVAGLAAARVLPPGWLRPPTAPARGGARALAWAGRHSLAVYLLHQPVLIALIWLGLRVAG